MYDNLVITLRNNADHYMTVEGEAGLVHLLTDAADAIEELCRKEKFHAFIWNTLGNDRMRLLIDAYREQEETE